MQFNIIPVTQFKTLPWKNGKGSTRELLVEKNQDGFNWRLSMAPVTVDGLFSDFSGYDRKLVLIEGEGISLAHSNGQLDQLKQRFDMAGFDGGWSTEARLHQGAITDFNVMTRQGICSAEVNIFREQGEHRFKVNCDQLMIYALDSSVDISLAEDLSLQLAATSLLHCTSVTQGLWTLIGGAVICVQISYQ